MRNTNPASDSVTILQTMNENLAHWKNEYKEAFVTEIDCYDDEIRAHVVEQLNTAIADRKAALVMVRGY
jgi:hypothetical protein